MLRLGETVAFERLAAGEGLTPVDIIPPAPLFACLMALLFHVYTTNVKIHTKLLKACNFRE